MRWEQLTEVKSLYLSGVFKKTKKFRKKKESKQYCKIVQCYVLIAFAIQGKIQSILQSTSLKKKSNKKVKSWLREDKGGIPKLEFSVVKEKVICMNKFSQDCWVD